MPAWGCPGVWGDPVQKDLLLPDFQPRALTASLVPALSDLSDSSVNVSLCVLTVFFKTIAKEYLGQK